MENLEPKIILSGETVLIPLNSKAGLSSKQALVNIELLPELSKYCWHVKKQGKHLKQEYAQNVFRVQGKDQAILMHRLIFSLVSDTPITSLPSIDHRNNNGLINTFNNLRLATVSQNRGNSLTSDRCDKLSRFKGVTWNKRSNKWQAQIGCTIQQAKKTVYLGVFESEIDAALAYNSAAREYFGSFACLNAVPGL